MRVSGVNNSLPQRKIIFSSKIEKQNQTDLYTGVNGDKLFFDGDASKYFKVVQNVSNQKVGSKFIIEPIGRKYEGLRLLITPESSIVSDDFKIAIRKQNQPSFKGRLYGSIRDDNGQVDTKMQTEYMRFWTTGMNKVVDFHYRDEKYAPYLKDDYNFYIPTDGDGTRYKDITALQGGVTKPASDIPASIHFNQMSLVQGVITNFAKTGKLDKMYEFVQVEPAKGSAFGFLEGLRKGQIPTDKPLVFSWGDNFSDVNVSRLMKNHEDSNAGFTVTVLPVDKSKTKALSIIKVDDSESRNIQKFVEKPQDDDFIESCVMPEFGVDKCLSAVGPYILSSEALNWIKENYTQNPNSFLNPDKGFDFSSMVIAPMLDAFNSGEIFDKNGEKLQMKFDLIDSRETWSDLGSQKDFVHAMKSLSKGAYAFLPFSMSYSLKQNIDEGDNITFNHKSKTLFNSLLTELDATASNVIAYCKDDGLSYN